MKKHNSNRFYLDHGITRRKFIGAAAAGSAALFGGGLSSLVSRSTSAASATWIEATIPQLQALMNSGALTSVQLTTDYLNQIATFNPLLHAVIETNPDALAIAKKLDTERHAGHLRGPLHGIPILVKDNLATADKMQTSAGSLALVGSIVPTDSVVVNRLRATGAVILGKANLSEWANFRGNAPFNGWSARGGFTRDPYLLSFDPCGSSSGSAVASAANLCATAVGTETDGSVVCPSGNNLNMGLKPTVGLVSQDGIIPIGHSQDTAGPMCRTVTDVAIMLGVMQSPFGEVIGHAVPSDYTQFLKIGSLKGARIGIDSRYFSTAYGGENDLVKVAQKGLDAMQTLGATLVPTDTGNPSQQNFKFYNDEFTVLLYEFKVQIAQYLAGLSNTSMRTLADLIAFDIAHCEEEMKYFGQEVFELSEQTSGNLNDPAYLSARSDNLAFARTNGIDAALKKDNLDAIVAPTYSFASSLPAVAGYPNLSISVGLTPEGKPAGLWMYSGFLKEPTLLAFAYDLEQAIKPRTQPGLLGSVPPEPPDAGICATLATAVAPRLVNGRAQISRHLGTGKPFSP
ncbi:MAG: amidase [Verrucomicrobia bacterium]|nr:MAG: amidase [Verrucomicrobiota bacterium]